MIKYVLKCAHAHRFESWFQSSEAFETLIGQGLVACAVCGSTEVEKAIMAPRVASANDPDPQRAPKNVPAPLEKPAHPMEAALKKLRAHVEANAENVGNTFASEARAIHHGEAPQRAIYGEARLDEAKALIDDGIEVAPLPFRSTRSLT